MLEAPGGARAAARADALEQLAHACRESGTFAITNHGLAGEVVAALLSVAEEFFALPMAEKMKVSRGHAASERGFRHQSLPNGRSHDSFLWIDDPEQPCGEPGGERGRNLWPQVPARFESVVRASAAPLAHLSRRVFRAIALSADLREDALDFMNEVRSIQLHHYDAETELPAHTDMAPLTIIFADAEGLQAELPGGRWAPAPSTGGVLSCMLGDVTMCLTNDRYKTAVHRVVRNARLRRSVLWEPACHPRAPIGPFPSFCSSAEPARYETKPFAEIVQDWLQAKQ